MFFYNFTYFSFVFCETDRFEKRDYYNIKKAPDKSPELFLLQIKDYNTYQIQQDGG